MNKEVLTLREAAKYLGITTDTLYKYLGERNIAGLQTSGNRWRFKKYLLDRWIERQCKAAGRR
jgi:excisionase family DNA binding protein